MSEAAIRVRFAVAIDDRGRDDKYIDRNEEREILQIALHLGIPMDEARRELVTVCADRGYLAESDLVRHLSERIRTAQQAGGVGRASFDQTVESGRTASQGTRTLREIQALVVQIMEDSGQTRVRTGWFRNWYTALKKDLGIA